MGCRCNRARTLMDRYVTEGLPAEQRERFEAHLRECPECRRQLKDLQRLVASLRRVPAPPVPKGFVERVMARARLEKDEHGVETPASIPSREEQGRMPRWINAVAAVAAGVVLGLLLGQQTWRQGVSEGRSRQPNARVDTKTIYSLDYLSGTPSGSFTERYLSLTGMSNDQEFYSP